MQRDSIFARCRFARGLWLIGAAVFSVMLWAIAALLVSWLLISIGQVREAVNAG